MEESSSYQKCNATLITAFYKTKSKSTYEAYLSWMTNFLTIKDCIVVFTSPDQEFQICALRPPDYPTIIIPMLIESFLISSIMSTEAWEKQEAMDPELNIGHNRDLYAVWDEKQIS